MPDEAESAEAGAGTVEAACAEESGEAAGNGSGLPPLPEWARLTPPTAGRPSAGGASGPAARAGAFHSGASAGGTGRATPGPGEGEWGARLGVLGGAGAPPAGPGRMDRLPGGFWAAAVRRWEAQGPVMGGCGWSIYLWRQAGRTDPPVRGCVWG